MYTQAKKLDTVLRVMASEGLPRFETGLEIANRLQTKKSEQTELYLILNKLVKDGFVEAKEHKEQVKSPVSQPAIFVLKYIITFEGLYHLETGAYLKQEKNRHSENIRMETLEKELKDNRNWIRYLTILIAFGTLVAAIYYGVEIYKEFHSFFHRHGLFWIWETIPKKP